MKFKISVGLNIALVIALGLMWFNYFLQDHYYRTFTGMILRRSTDQILRGNKDLVHRVLSKVGSRPTYGDLISNLENLAAEKKEQVVEPNRSLAPTSDSTSSVHGAEN